MDAARPDEADDVKAAIRFGGAVAGGHKGRPHEERAVVDGRVDPREVLEHRPPGTQIEVPDLGVAHLTGRQPDGMLGRSQPGVGPPLEEPAPGGHRCGGDRVGRRDCDQHRSHRGRRGRSAGAGLATARRAAKRRSRTPDHAIGLSDRRASAVRPARATIPAISSGLSDAPPTSAPSIDGSARNSAMFAAVTLPP